MASGILKRGILGLMAAMALIPANNVSAVSRAGSSANDVAIEAGNLRSIATWLKQSGRDGYLAGEVADVVGIPRKQSEDMLEAKQRGFRTDDILRIAQVSADEKRDFLLFMVQRPDGEVYFYLSSVREGLKKAFISIPSRNLVVPLEETEAQENFQQEVVYWQDKVALK
jgi:predicted XRE-type DNA-binding protein